MKHHQSTTNGSHQSSAKKAVRSATKGEAAARAQGPASGAGRDEIIRQTAYAFYEARGHLDGHALEDWLAAEAQVEQASTESPQATDSAAPLPH